MLDNLTKHEKYILIFLLGSIIAGSTAVSFKKQFIKNSEEYRDISSGADINKAIVESKVVNINLGMERDFEKLPGIGPALSKRIVLYRRDNGSFKDIMEIMKVSGIGPKKFNAIKEFLVLE